MLILVLTLVVLLILGVPIAYALGLSSLFYLLLEQPDLAIVVPQRIFSGMNNYALLSLPLFILMGQVMNSSGITKRLIDVAICPGFGSYAWPWSQQVGSGGAFMEKLDLYAEPFPLVVNE